MRKLTGAERLLKTIRHEEPDVVPTFENYIHPDVMQAIKPGTDYEGFCEYMDLDAVTYSDKRTTRWEVVDESKKLYRSEWGSVAAFSSVSTYLPVLREPAIKSERDLDNYTPPDPDRPDSYKHLEAAVKRFKGERAVIASVTDPFRTLTNHLRGEVELFKDMIRNPAMVERMSEIARNFARKYTRNCIAAGADIIFVTGDYAVTQAPFVSREFTARFLIPGLKELVDIAHSGGLPLFDHSDGNIMPIVDLMVDTGIDGLHPIDPVAGMDLAVMKRMYGDRTCLLGNVDCGNLLSFGTKEEVRDAVKVCISKAGGGGGYVCMSSNTIHAAVSPENYVEMVRAIREYGQYPLTL